MLFKFRRNRISDIDIVRGFQDGNKQVQSVFYEQCRGQFYKGTANYGLLSDYEKSDLFQDAFIILWQKMESKQLFVDGDRVKAIGRTQTSEVTDLMGYFMRIVKNKYLEFLHTAGRTIAINENVATGHEEIVDTLYWDNDIELEKERIVSQCLLALPKSCLEILTMFYYEKKSLEDILAERQENVSYDGLKSRKSKCMTNLKNRIAESFHKAGIR